MTPFVYHLYHIPTGLNYYGARYCKNCSPSDLWTTYFSSSNQVKKLIEQYGKDSFIATVRKTFNTVDETILWESKFLNKINAQHNDKWLNQHNGKANFVGPHVISDSVKSVLRSKITGIKRSEDTRQKIREKAKEREARRKETGWVMPQSGVDKRLATTKERIAAGTINPYSEERNRKMGASKRGAKRHYLPDGSFIMVKPQADQ